MGSQPFCDWLSLIQLHCLCQNLKQERILRQGLSVVRGSLLAGIMQQRCPSNYIVQLELFESSGTVGMREAGWSYRRTVAHGEHDVLVVLWCW